MRLVLATIITGSTLVKLIVGALVAGLGVTIAFSLLIYCTDRAAELRASARRSAAAIFTAASGLALLLCLGIVAYGFVLMASKPK